MGSEHDAPINVNSVGWGGGGGSAGKGWDWQVLKFLDQILQSGKRKVNQKCQKKPPPLGKKSKQTIL